MFVAFNFTCFSTFRLACTQCDRDILVVMDISGSTTNEEFKNNLKFVLMIFHQYVGAIEEGNIWVGIVQIGGNPLVVCVNENVEDVFQVCPRSDNFFKNLVLCCDLKGESFLD